MSRSKMVRRVRIRIKPDDDEGTPLSAAAASADTFYAIGRGKPPQHKRFQRGQSGNPKGRPKRKKKNLRTIIEEALAAKITIREGDRVRSISRAEGLVRRQLEQALKGDPRAMAAWVRLAMAAGLFGAAESQSETPPLTREEEKILAELLTQNPAKQEE